jgi:predicted O-methyltransferase YrrM
LTPAGQADREAGHHLRRRARAADHRLRRWWRGKVQKPARRVLKPKRLMKRWTLWVRWWRRKGRRWGRRGRRVLYRNRLVRWWRGKRKLRRSVRKAFRKAFNRATVGERDRLRLRSAGALGPLREFSRARPRGALAPDYTDLWFLYREVRRRRPTTLLEFGSGCSTVVLAFALYQNREGHLWSLDADAEWARATEAALPEALRSLATVVHAPVHEDDRDVQGWSYRPLPNVDPDFVYLDGPALTRERKVAFDVLDLESRLQPGCLVVVDGRGENVRYLEARLTRKHSFTVLPPWRSLFEFEE